MQITINSESLALLCGAARLGASRTCGEQLTATLDAIGDAEAIMREARESDPEEPCRVRRVADGCYARAGFVMDVQRSGCVLTWVNTSWLATVYPRRQAVVIARALIVLSGDYGIEVEPANG